MDWLDNAIVEYLRNNADDKPDSIQIVSHFKLTADVTYAAIKRLEAAGRIQRHNHVLSGWAGKHHYTAVDPEA
jgi:hypothetical protein